MRYVCEILLFMNSFNSFCKVDVEFVVMKYWFTFLRRSEDKFSVFIAVFTVSIFLWKSCDFRFNSDIYKAMLPMISPFTIELIIKIGMAIMISY